MSGIRWTPVAVIRPNRCMFIPFVGSHDPKGFFEVPGVDFDHIDTHPSAHPYISVIAVEEMARMLGWQPAVDAVAVNAKADAKVATVATQLAEARAEVERLEGLLAAVDTLKNATFIHQNRAGRPPKVAA